MRILITAFFCFLLALPAGAVGFYYVSNSGDDGNDGLSFLTPWQTLSKVNTFAFSANPVILFDGGSIWTNSSLIPSISGMSFGAYNSGSPTISNAPIALCITNKFNLSFTNITFASPFAGTNAATYPWTGIDYSNPAAIYVTTTANKTVYSNLTFNGCSFLGGSDGLNVFCPDLLLNLQILGCTYAHSGSPMRVQAPTNYWAILNPIMQDCDVSSDGCPYMSDSSDMDMDSASNGIVQFNHFHDYSPLDAPTQGGMAGFQWYYGLNCVMQFNIACRIHSTNNFDGVGLDNDAYCQNCTIRWNYVYNCDGGGILDSGSTYSSIYGNILAWNNQVINTGTRSGSIVNYGLYASIYNNTILGVDDNGYNEGGDNYAQIYNNIFYVNGSVMSFHQHTYMGNNLFSPGATFNYQGTAGLTIDGVYHAQGQNPGFYGDPLFISTNVVPLTNPHMLTFLTNYVPASGGQASQNSFPGLQPTNDFRGIPTRERANLGAIDTNWVKPSAYQLPIVFQPSIDSGLVAYYRMWGDYQDQVSGQFGTATNGPTFVTGRDGAANHALSFNGSQIFTLANQSAVQNLTNGFSYSCWVNLSNAPAPTGGFSFVSQWGPSPRFACLVLGGSSQSWANTTTFIGVGSGGENRFISSPLVLTPGTWHSVISSVQRLDPSNENYLINTYVDGNLMQGASTNYSGGITPSTDFVVVGNHSDMSGGYQGAIGEVRVYNRPLSAGDAKTLANQKPK